MTERVYRYFSAQLTYISAVCNLNALGYSDHYGRFGRCQFFHVSHEFINIKYSLRKVDRITTAAVVALSQRCCRCQPSCVTSHDLYDTDGGLLRTERLVVADDLFQGSRNIFCCGTVSGTVVCHRKVIVDGLGNAHESLRLIVCCCIIGQHLHRIHRVIAACIEQTLNVMLLHDLKYFLIYILMSLDLGHLETAGTQERRGCSLKQFDSGLIIQIVTQIDHFII